MIQQPHRLLMILFIVVTHSVFVFGQKDDDEPIRRGFAAKVQALTLLPYDNRYAADYGEEFNLKLGTVVTGVNGELNYYFIPYFGVGIGGGYEIVSHPRIKYFPMYANFIGVASENKSTLFAKLSFGSHLGDLAERGFVFRAGLGVRVKVKENILSYFELTYSFQNLYKTFELSAEPVNYYNIESLGVTVGMGIN